MAKRGAFDEVVRIVKVNRNLRQTAKIDAAGRERFFDNAVVESMPRGSDDTVEVIYVNPGHYFESTAAVRAALAEGGYTFLSDPLAVAADMDTNL